jgi:hypothetical protein
MDQRRRAMPLTSADIYPLAQRLHALIPERLWRWTGKPSDRDDRPLDAKNHRG